MLIVLPNFVFALGLSGFYIERKYRADLIALVRVVSSLIRLLSKY